MQPPIIFLSFANDYQNPLPQLERESDVIYQLFTPAANQQQVQIHRDPFATTDKISHYLTHYHNRVAIFHYGGHASSDHLFLNDQLAYSDGIAYQLAQEKKLKLVFLNGCSTYDQVKLLLQSGIPAVIATSAPIADETATEFAKAFYQAIAKEYTIGEAFEKAAATIKTKSFTLPKVYRDLVHFPSNDGKIPWGLYISPFLTPNEILEYKIIDSKVKSKSTHSHLMKRFYNVNTPILIYSIITIIIFALFAHQLTDQFFNNNPKQITEEIAEEKPSIENESSDESPKPKEQILVPEGGNDITSTQTSQEKKESQATPILFLEGYVKVNSDEATPLEGVLISAGSESVKSNASGFFHLPIEGLSNTNDITVYFQKKNYRGIQRRFYNFPKRNVIIYLKPTKLD